MGMSFGKVTGCQSSGPEPSPGPSASSRLHRPGCPPGCPTWLLSPCRAGTGGCVFGELDGPLELQQGDVPVQILLPVVPGVDVDLSRHGDLFNLPLIPVQTPAEKKEKLQATQGGRQVPQGGKLPALRGQKSGKQWPAPPGRPPGSCFLA